MFYDANKKSLGVTYLLWFFLGAVGGHRFYLGKTGSAIAIPVLAIIGFLTAPIGIGLAILVAVGIWVLVDAFLIPGWIRGMNTKLARALSNGEAVPQ
ncbi:NINE protein [Allopusillimonas soli]|uniref:NINE protein n=2 Tax=Allopusillimonas soli TaxID=659016 RepID=A0A853FJJ2_9BURK|nr:NINE protein [Allopusillimonas soli]TEA70154.1 NINE protein [Allopusillimonas soli]